MLYFKKEVSSLHHEEHREVWPVRGGVRERTQSAEKEEKENAPSTAACEMRRDPLTGRSGRVAHGLGFRIRPLDVAPLIAASQRFCPFCPDRLFEVTPKFPVEIVPEGRLQRGEAVLFPNLVPYDEHIYLTPSLWGTDTTALQHLYQEHFMVQTPEAAATALQQAIKL